MHLLVQKITVKVDETSIRSRRCYK